MTEGLTNIPNAPHWLNNSVVVVKEDYLAEDEAWIINNLVRLDSTNAIQLTSKHKDILTVQRMVQAGSVVAVKRSGDRVKTVHLPDDAAKLLWADLQYIVAEIEKLNEPPMSEDEQSDFLDSANGSSSANLKRVK